MTNKKPEEIKGVDKSVSQSSCRTGGIIDVSKKKEFWKAFSVKVKGTFKINHTSDHTYNKLIINIPYKHHLVQFIETDHKPLKIRCKMNISFSSRFNIWREDIIEKITIMFGAQDIKTGHREFDKAFVIKGENEEQTRKLLSDDKIRQFLLENDFSSIGTYQDDEDMGLLFSVSRFISNEKELADIFQFFCSVIDRMEMVSMV